MKYAIKPSKRFEKDLKRCEKRGYDMRLIKEVITLLAETGSLPATYRPHKLSGDYAGCWECHIKPDWLLLWEQYDNELVLLLTSTGSHSDLFGKGKKRSLAGNSTPKVIKPKSYEGVEFLFFFYVLSILRIASVDPPLCLRSVFVPAPFLLRFKSLSRMGLTWDLLRTYLGLASDASKQFTSPNPFLDAKLRNSELAVRT